MASLDQTPTAQRHCPSCGSVYPADYAVCPRDATPLRRGEANDDPLIGSILGDSYEIVRRIGEGGMGRVYEARHVRLGRRFAVKLMHQMFASDRDALARFRREAMAAAAIVSPFVAQVVDINATRDGQPYLVYELLEGEDLGSLLEREGTLPIGRAARLARQLTQGLRTAHEAGVVHRDLKPENVMIIRGSDGSEQVKVLDFGIAKVAQDEKLTRTGAVLGTPAYMAPEQARGGSEIDQRCDVYALGAILYRALTGRAAFSGEDAGRTLTSVIWDEPQRPKTLRRDLPDGLELVIQRAMAKDPDARFASMAELDVALTPFDGDTQTSAAPAHKPADVGRAATIVAGPGVATGRSSPSAAASSTANSSGASFARPRAVVFGLVALAWCVVISGSLIAASLTELTHHALSPLERILVVVLALVLSMPLAILEVRRLVRGAWRNTATMLGRANVLGRASALSLGAYAIVAAPARFWAILHHSSAPMETELGAIVAALLVGGYVLWRGR
jgi:serine/threonine protein kinase